MKKILALILLMFLCLPVFAKEKIELNKDTFGVYVFKIDTNKYGDKIKPYMAPTLTTPKKLYEDKCYDLVVNGGFFDVRNGKTVSYVTIDGKTMPEKEYPFEEVLVAVMRWDTGFNNTTSASLFDLLYPMQREINISPIA